MRIFKNNTLITHKKKKVDSKTETKAQIKTKFVLLCITTLL